MLFFNNNKQIKAIIEALKQIKNGDLNKEISINSDTNIGNLAVVINNTLSSLRQKIQGLEKENLQIQVILNSMIEGVIAVDKEARIILVNPSVEDCFSINRKDYLGKFFLEVIRNNDIFEVVDNVLKKAEPISKEIKLVLPVQKIFQINATPLFKGKLINGCLLVLHDITEIRRLEKVRSDFVANISHELKTPLTSIKGFVETLLEGALEDKANSHEFLKIIQDHADRLNNLVNDLLELSHLESKEIVFELRDVSLKEILNKVLLGFKTQLKNKDIRVFSEIDPGLVLKVDADKIEQVFTNLVDNGIKFNKQGGSLRIYTQDSGSEIKFIVEDSGIGIPQKDVLRIFERFYRVEKARSREMGGTGLGLSIVKHIVELHGGKVGVESTEGLGSKFWFILPK